MKVVTKGKLNTGKASLRYAEEQDMAHESAVKVMHGDTGEAKEKAKEKARHNMNIRRDRSAENILTGKLQALLLASSRPYLLCTHECSLTNARKDQQC
ncbi:unnamed protein product [Sphagnum tenellum]